MRVCVSSSGVFTPELLVNRITVKEQYMTSSFWEYLKGFVKTAASPEESAERLLQYIEKLKNAMK